MHVYVLLGSFLSIIDCTAYYNPVCGPRALHQKISVVYCCCTFNLMIINHVANYMAAFSSRHSENVVIDFLIRYILITLHKDAVIRD